ncbi:sigma-70 family RNA polymerase sigma factor [Streptomyces sp. NPDC005302]|uniref:RNA polymerase sigma factor n=1 Tax=Streptomyces sp. NPDC005302 TaxID=3154675 RepID=UPI0033AE7AFF
MTPPTDEAFDSLYRQWYRPLLAQAMFISGGRRAVADDAVQEAFLQCWQRWHATHLEPVRSWPPWLRTTVVHEVLRLQKEVGSVGFDTDAHDHAGPEIDLASLMDARGAYRTVLERIVLLSDKQREVMGRCAIAGQPLGDAAKEMHIQVATARVHLHRARQALEDVRGQLRELGVIDASEGRQ